MIYCFTQDDGDDGWVVCRDGRIVDDLDARLEIVSFVQDGVRIEAQPFGVCVKRNGVFGYVRADCKNAEGRYKQAAFYASHLEVLNPPRFTTRVFGGLLSVGLCFSEGSGVAIQRRLQSVSTRCLVFLFAFVLAAASIVLVAAL